MDTYVTMDCTVSERTCAWSRRVALTRVGTFLSCCWFLAASSYCTAEELPAVSETEDVFFDKSTCEAGLHKISIDENLQAPDIFNVRWKTTATDEDIVVTTDATPG